MTTPMTPSIDLPLHGASFSQACSRFFRKYATFSGRATRSEFWWVTLALVLVNGLIFAALGVFIGIGTAAEGSGAVVASIGVTIVYLVSAALSLAIIVPNIALMVRRLHDTNRPGTYVLFALIPFGIGAIILLVFLASPSDPAGIRFDSHPTSTPLTSTSGTPSRDASTPHAI